MARMAIFLFLFSLSAADGDKNTHIHINSCAIIHCSHEWRCTALAQAEISRCVREMRLTETEFRDFYDDANTRQRKDYCDDIGDSASKCTEKNPIKYVPTWENWVV